MPKSTPIETRLGYH